MTLNAFVLLAALLFQQSAPAQLGGTISGRITYADGTPYQRGLLSMQPVSQESPNGDTASPIGFISDKGDFRFTKVPPGRYVIRTGDSAAYYPGVSTLSAATVLTVTPGSVSENLNFVLPAALTGFRVSGRVIVPPSQPKPPTEVSANGTQYAFAKVATDGTFELLHVQAGSYSLQASPSIGTASVRIAVDRDIGGIELMMPRLFEIAGKVTVEGRAGPSVLFDDRKGPAFTLIWDGPVQTRAGIQPEGTFKTAVLEGEYRIHADRVPAGYYIKALTSDDRDLLTNRLQIVASETPVQIAATLSPSAGVKVSGKVTGIIGDVAAARLTFVGTVATNGFEAAIRPDGSYALPLVMPGTYIARFSSNALLASPPVSITIPNRDVADLEIAIPPPVSVSGRITVDGSGPLPKFTVLLARGSISNWNPQLNDAAIESLQREARGGALQVIKVDVDALPDGSFKIPLPEGEYRVATPRTGIPSPYVLRSISHGGVNLLVDPLVVSSKESSEIQVGFGTTSSNPWSRVSGRVVGFESVQGPFRVALEGISTSTMEVPANPDGTFEFPRVLQNSSYTARLRPENKVASTPRVSVGAKDIDNVEIVIPHEREITVRAVVEGGGPVPGFVMSLDSPSSKLSVLVKPDSSGISRIRLPDDERQVSFGSLPLGYDVKSAMYGFTDLRACVQGISPRCSYAPLKIAGNANTDLEVVFSRDPDIPFGKISGRVTGLSPESSDVRLVLNDAATFSTFEQPVGAGGSFSFASLPQGTYVPSLSGVTSNQSRLLSPSLINVNGIDSSGIEIAAPSGSSKQDPRQTVTEAPAGARVSELGGSSRSAAREAAAVATLRTITTAEITFLSSNKGNFGTMSQMIDAQLLPESFRGAVNGFNFGVISVGADFVAAAIPSNSESASYGFFITPDGVVRYSTIDSLAPAGSTGVPVNQ